MDAEVPGPPLWSLLRIDSRDQAGLEWVKNRVRFWLTANKRRRALPQAAPDSPEETAVIQALTVLEEAAGRLLALMDGRQG